MDGGAGAYYDAPATGILAGGLVLDGARFSKQSGCVSDCAPGQLRGECPVLWLKPSLTSEASKRATAAIRARRNSLLDRAKRASLAMARRQSLDSNATGKSKGGLADVVMAAAGDKAATGAGTSGPEQARAAAFGSVSGSSSRQRGGMFSSLRSVMSSALESQASQQLAADKDKEQEADVQDAMGGDYKYMPADSDDEEGGQDDATSGIHDDAVGLDAEASGDLVSSTADGRSSAGHHGGVPVVQGTYLCPVYVTSARRGALTSTGRSVNFVVAVALPCEGRPSKWVRRGLALLL